MTNKGMNWSAICLGKLGPSIFYTKHIEMTTDVSEKSLLPHHQQQSLCTTRLPYRQGRKLTAVKVYTITAESNHLLVFGVPALNLRQEAKALFLKFGNLLQFHVSKEHPGEVFSETYHAKYDRIHSARIAKRMLDTRSFYGGSLHVCYAPELETVQETRQKLFQREKDVISRLRNLDKEKCKQQTAEDKTPDLFNEIEDSTSYGTAIQNEVTDSEDKVKLNMGDKNIIYMNKRKASRETVIEKKFKPYSSSSNSRSIPIIDFTSTEKETLSNINEALNYNKFGNEIIRSVDVKPVNRIKFNKKSS